MGSAVSLVQMRGSEKGIKDSITEALSLVNFNPRMNTRSVIIKPNLCYYWSAATGYTTDPRVVSGVIDWVRKKCGVNADIRIAEADASAMRVHHAFTMLGYQKLALEKKVKLVNLSEDMVSEKRVTVGGREITFQIPTSLLNCDLFINVPKLKIMRETKITCAFKNIFGCNAYPRKIIYHPFLNEAIVAINKILRPDVTIVDGLVALGRYPVKLGLIMASPDAFSIDWVASQIIGYKPSRVKFLRIAMKEKMGEPKAIAVYGQSIDKFKECFPRPSFFSVQRYWKVFFKLFNLYIRISKDVKHPSLEGI